MERGALDDGPVEQAPAPGRVQHVDHGRAPLADCPATVTRCGSPPNAAMSSRTQHSAAIWSSSP
ncbi:MULTISPECIES: hypothetical protein [unclassified Streptomyces]|uniref:hypothetical protein n=1 Tax=unclassified Streptomyces TaxID=2593676 RepID=UPI002E30089D|nr:hypothetical protein [Streptomyces sp. NBC_01356]